MSLLLLKACISSLSSKCWGSIQDVSGVSARGFDQLDLSLWQHRNRNAPSVPNSFSLERSPEAAAPVESLSDINCVAEDYLFFGVALIHLLSFCWRGQNIKNAKYEPYIKSLPSCKLSGLMFSQQGKSENLNRIKHIESIWKLAKTLQVFLNRAIPIYVALLPPNGEFVNVALDELTWQ